jgi:Mg-dependent DNase
MQLTLLTEALFNSSVVALGEAGLDKHIDISLSLQREIFAAQVELSEEFEKPLVVHCVKAWDELLAVKKELKPRKTWVIHGFRGNRMLAEQLVRKGFYLSFGARFNTEALHAAWPNRLLAETDEAETSIEDVYAAIANALNVPIPLLALELRKNVKEVFSI